MMVAHLQSYFCHLQSQTGAEDFVIVRDDASTSSPLTGSASNDRPLHRRQSLASKPKFSPETHDLKPPSPPRRQESTDDVPSLKSRSSPSTPQSRKSRLHSLFGADMAKTIESTNMVRNSKFEEFELNALANLSAPRFPVRKGSRDDLSTLRNTRRLMPQLSPGQFANKQLELTSLIDEVTFVLERSNSDASRNRRRRSIGDPLSGNSNHSYA